jgi:threonine aldolase
MIDLRSDTVTRPTPEMRRVIAAAEVGDDVFHDDPSVLELEARVAGLLGKDDAIYVASGTMSNQLALRTHTEPGDVVLASENAHILVHELGAPAALSGIHIHQLPSELGTFTGDAIRAAIPDRTTWAPSINAGTTTLPDSLFEPIKLVAVENTHNAAGGTVWDPAQLADVVRSAKELGLAVHLDGARLWNAAVASGSSEAELAAGFDTVSVCFSKGLGAPMGSALVGSAAKIDRARRFKQMFGGGFRQAGMMAAAALYAVDHQRERLAEDHTNAATFAAGLAEVPGIELDMATVQSNMIYFEVTAVPIGEFVRRCAENGVALFAAGPTSIRVVCNLHVDRADVDTALAVIEQAAGA